MTATDDEFIYLCLLKFFGIAFYFNDLYTELNIGIDFQRYVFVQ